MKTIYSLHLLDEEFEQLQTQPMGNFTNNSDDWYNYEQDYYSIDNPSKDLELLLSLKGYEYDVETDSKGWQTIVKRTMKNV